MGIIRNVVNDYPLPTRLMEMSDPTSEVDRLISKHNEKMAQKAIEAMKNQHFVSDWRMRFRED